MTIYLKLQFFLLFLLLFLLSSTPGFSNEKHPTQITGQVRDKITRAPIPNANIFIEQSNIGTISANDGRFLLENIPEDPGALIIRHIGYDEKRITLKSNNKNINRFNIFLTPKVLVFDELTFTSNRKIENLFQSHQDVAIASRDNIERRTSPNTADALREVPGVLVQKTTAGHGAPIIRGLIGKDVLLLYNGIRLNKPTFRFGANQYMNTISAESLDRIEVTKGPGSVMYGSDAIGGIVNMISTPFAFGEPHESHSTTVSMRYGTADKSGLFHAGYSNTFGLVSFSGDATLKKIGDLRAGSDVGAQSPTGYDEINGNMKLSFHVNDGTKILLDLLSVQQEEVPRFDKYVTGQYEQYLYEPQNRYLAAMTVKTRPRNINWITSLDWNLSYQLEEEGTIERKTGSELLTKNRNDLTTLGSFLQVNSVWRNNHVLTFGYEFYHDKVESGRTVEVGSAIENQRGNFPDGSTYQSFGLFVNDDYIVTANFDVTLGLRWSQMQLWSPLEYPWGDFEDTFSDVTGTIGLSYRPTPALNLIGRYAKGFRAPNFNDSVVLKVSNSGVDAPSPGLAPEKSHDFEIGAKVNHERFSGSAFLFYNRLIDLIDRYEGTYNGLRFYDENGNGIRDADEVPIYQKRNAAKAYIAGWELSGKYRLNAAWSLSGAAFWTYGQNETFDEPMSRIPPFMGTVKLHFTPVQRLSLEGYLRAATAQNRLSARDIDDSRIPESGTPGWTTLNFRTTYELRPGLKLDFMFENILDETYKEHGSGVYSPGRNLVVGIRFQGL